MHLRLNSILYRIVSFLGLVGASSISIDQLESGEACPILFNTLPACYLITIVFLLLFILSFLKYKKIELAILIFGFLFASFASISNLFGIAQCPLAGSGMPMCYIAFTFFCILLVANIITFRFKE